MSEKIEFFGLQDRIRMENDDDDDKLQLDQDKIPTFEDMYWYNMSWRCIL